MKLNNHHLSLKILTRAFPAYKKVVRTYVGFYATYIRAFEDFLSAMDALSNAFLTHQIIDPPTLDRYLRVIS